MVCLEMELREGILFISIVLIVVLGVGCAVVSTSAELSQSTLPGENQMTTSYLSPTAEASLTVSTPALASTSLLSIGDPTTTPTETFAAAVISTYPYSTKLLFAPSGVPMEYQFIETTVGPDLDWYSDCATSTNGTYRVFTACNSNLCQDRVFIENLDTGQVFEFLFSARLTWRPISNMRWLDNDVLVFDQWSQPHYGFVFAVDIREQELFVVQVTDECFVYGICE
jgi:hypothetical protein